MFHFTNCKCLSVCSVVHPNAKPLKQLKINHSIQHPSFRNFEAFQLVFLKEVFWGKIIIVKDKKIQDIGCPKKDYL